MFLIIPTGTVTIQKCRTMPRGSMTILPTGAQTVTAIQAVTFVTFSDHRDPVLQNASLQPPAARILTKDLLPVPLKMHPGVQKARAAATAAEAAANRSEKGNL